MHQVCGLHLHGGDRRILRELCGRDNEGGRDNLRGGDGVVAGRGTAFLFRRLAQIPIAHCIGRAARQEVGDDELLGRRGGRPLAVGDGDGDLELDAKPVYVAPSARTVRITDALREMALRR
jgi:hypothetical protein